MPEAKVPSPFLCKSLSAALETWPYRSTAPVPEAKVPEPIVLCKSLLVPDKLMLATTGRNACCRVVPDIFQNMNHERLREDQRIVGRGEAKSMPNPPGKVHAEI